VVSGQGCPRHVSASGRLIILRHLKPTFFTFFRLRSVLRAPAQIANNFQRNSLACGNLNLLAPCVISGFRRNANDICDLLGFYAWQIDSFVSTFLDNLSVPFLIEDGTDRLYRHVGRLSKIPKERRSTSTVFPTIRVTS
jgi:hypothetical protein